MVGSERERGR